MSRPGVLHVALTLDPGGTERLILELVRRTPPDFSAAVCCLDAAGAWADQVHALGVPLTALHRASGFRPSLAAGIAGVARRVGARVLHCHHYSPFVYGSLARAFAPRLRIVYTEHGRLGDRPPSGKRRLANRLLMAGVPHVVAVSHELRTHMLAEGAPARTVVVPNGIELGSTPSPHDRLTVRQELGLAEDDVVVMSVARLDSVKDLGALVRAVVSARAHAPRLRLVLVGDGPERDALAQLVTTRGAADVVRFLGHRDDARRLLAGADIYANSSEIEGTSVTILEAMAAALPVVATAVGGTPDVVLDGLTGRLVPRRSPEALAGALVECASDGRRRTEWGAAGRTRAVDKYSITKMVDAYADIYRSLARF